MSKIRLKIEKWFENFARSIYHHRIKAIIALLLLTAALATQIPKLEIDTSTEGFLHENDPAKVAYDQFRDQFGRDEVIIVAIKPPQIFNMEFLKKLARAHEDLEENVPHLDEVTSLVNARNTRGEGDELIVEDFLENWPNTPAELNDLKKRAMSNPMYRNMILSADGRITTIIIRTQSHTGDGDLDVMAGFEDSDIAENSENRNAERRYLSDKENTEAVLAVRRIMEKYRSPDFTYQIAGSPDVTHFLKQSMMSDVRKFLLLAVLVIGAFLLIMFQRFSGLVLPMVVVFLSLLSTIGIMALTGTKFKLPTQILPSFLLAVCVGASVHILAIFYQRYRNCGDKEDAIAYALGHSGLAVVMTHLTTASGLMSFTTAEVAPIADLGVFSGIGVLLGLVYTLVLLPALLAITPLKQASRTPGSDGGTRMGRLLEGIANFSTTHPWKIIFVSAVLMIISGFYITQIRFSHSPLEWFPKNSDIRIATESIDQDMRGSLSLEVVIDTGVENGLYDPNFLQRLDKAAVYTENLSYEDVFVGKSWSLNTIIKEINQALHANQEEYYTIPERRNLIAQELLLFENSGSDDLEDFVDSQFSKVRFTIKVPFKDAVKYAHFIHAVQNYFDETFPEASITITGMMALLFRTVSNAIMSMARSYVTAFGVITVLMILLIGRVRIGLLSMIPNLAPIILTLGVMGFIDLPMDLFSMMVASMAIGLAVDDTIHFMHNFRRYYEESGDPVWAVHETLQTTGRAMLVTTIVLSLGFSTYAFATMQNLVNLGLLTSFTITMALVADYFLAPALMVLVNPPLGTRRTSMQNDIPDNNEEV